MALFGLLLAQIVDALQADEQTARTVHKQRNSGVQQNDNAEWSDEQTMDVELDTDGDPTDWEVEMNGYEYGGPNGRTFEICAPLWPGDYWLESTLVVRLDAML